MDPRVLELADKLGVKLSSRVCGGHDLNQPCFDGNTLAIRWLKAKYQYNEKLNDDELVACSAIPMSDSDLVHELCHYWAAKPEQRDLPEYGLGALVFSCYHFESTCPQVVDEEEGNFQEHLAQFIEIYLCQQWGIPLEMTDEPSWEEGKDWDKYFLYKVQEAIERGKLELRWKALIRFREMLPEIDALAC